MVSFELCESIREKERKGKKEKEGRGRGITRSVVCKMEGEWWFGHLKEDKTKGWFPSSYVNP